MALMAAKLPLEIAGTTAKGMATRDFEDLSFFDLRCDHDR